MGNFKVTYEIIDKKVYIYINGKLHLYLIDKNAVIGIHNYYEDNVGMCIEILYNNNGKALLIYDSEIKWKKIKKTLLKIF